MPDEDGQGDEDDIVGGDDKNGEKEDKKKRGGKPLVVRALVGSGRANSTKANCLARFVQGEMACWNVADPAYRKAIAEAVAVLSDNGYDFNIQALPTQLDAVHIVQHIDKLKTGSIATRLAQYMTLIAFAACCAACCAE